MPAILALHATSPEMAMKLHPRYDYTVAEVIWAIRHEMASNIEDVLARRVRILFLDAQAAIECAPKVASILARELKHTKEWEEEEVKKFSALALHYLLN